MIVNLHTRLFRSLDDVRAFLDGSGPVEFVAPCGDERRQWVAGTFMQFRYFALRRLDRGTVLTLVRKVTGFSKAQTTRLVAQWLATRRLDDRRGPPPQAFRRRYTDADVARLVELDRLHNQLSGPATKKIAERAFRVFGDADYENLAGISVAHLYNLRASLGYRRQRGRFEPTRPTAIAIGERRRPQPNGEPGYLRVDSVHQGDFDGIKGIYIINLVDAVTQYEAVYAVERISEIFLIPVLEHALQAFPFLIRGFHSDNGSEYINHQVAGLLKKLHIEFTKCRARRSNDNGLVESKNASVVRKHLGYSHIPSHHANAVSAFTRDVLSPYLNFHRPCFFPEITLDAKGRQRRRYRYQSMDTPYQKLKSLPNAESFLKPDTSFQQLDQIALAMTDNQAARHVNSERQKLFSMINKTKAA